MGILFIYFFLATFIHPLIVAGCTLAGIAAAVWKESRGRISVDASVKSYAIGLFGGYVAGVIVAVGYGLATHETFRWFH